jgi:DNA-binding transcriptional MerR regulator
VNTDLKKGAGMAARPIQTRLMVRESQGGGGLDIQALAREAGVHPELVRRLVALGVLDPPAGGRTNRPVFPRDAAARVARAARLRRDLGLNYAGALLAVDLLDRIEQLEERLRRSDTEVRLHRSDTEVRLRHSDTEVRLRRNEPVDPKRR